jgi:hypothetical protein
MTLPVPSPQNQEPRLSRETLAMMKDRRFDSDLPPVLSSACRARVAGEITLISDYVAPASSDWILARVTAALAHYYVADLPEGVQMGMATDWLRIMEKFPAWSVQKAFLDWLASEEKRKPTPAAIAKRAAVLSNDTFKRRDRLQHCLNAARQEGEGERIPPTEEEKARVAKLVRTLTEKPKTQPLDTQRYDDPYPPEDRAFMARHKRRTDHQLQDQEG